MRVSVPSFHFGSRRVVSLNELEHFAREHEREEQQALLDTPKRYHGSFGYGEPRPEIQCAQERLNAMQRLQGQATPPEQGAAPVSIRQFCITSPSPSQGGWNVLPAGC